MDGVSEQPRGGFLDNFKAENSEKNEASERRHVSTRRNNPSRMQGKDLARSVALSTGIMLSTLGVGLGARHAFADQPSPEPQPQPEHTQSIGDKTPAQYISEVAGVQEKPSLQAQNYELFNNLSDKQKAKLDAEFVLIDKQLKQYDIYHDFDNVVKDYDPIVTAAAQKTGVPKEIIFGMIFIESSGNPNAVSPDGTAVGIGQFREDAAREMNLVVDPKTGRDDRKNPTLAIPALAGYVAKYGHLFGDNNGIGVGNYHMGPGNMMEAIEVFAIDEYGSDPGESFDALGKIIKDNKLNLDTIYSNPAVEQQVLSTKQDDTVRYAKKAQVAAMEYKRRMMEKAVNAQLDKTIPQMSESRAAEFAASDKSNKVLH